VFQESWKLLFAVAVIGGLAGGAFARVRTPLSVGECTLSIGTVPADPTRPADRALPLRAQDSVLAWLRAAPTLQQFVKSDSKGFALEAEAAGQGLVLLRLTGPNEADVKSVLDGIVTSIEKDHRALYDEWKQSAAEFSKRLNEQSANLGSVVVASTAAQERRVAMDVTYQAAASALTQGALYARPTVRVSPIWVAAKSHGTVKLGVAGALAGLIVAWVVAYVLAASKRVAT
jgi:hypothetical protein